MKKQVIVLDTNLAVLLVVGLTNRHYIEKHKKLKAYDVQDFDMLFQLIDHASSVIFSPNILTETSNLLRQIHEPIRSEVAMVLANLITKFGEKVVVSSIAVARKEYAELGLADAVMLEIASQYGAIILTADNQLFLAALRAELPAENFNHLKERLLIIRSSHLTPCHPPLNQLYRAACNRANPHARIGGITPFAPVSRISRSHVLAEA